jgi:excisionase family DNA binding protein
VSDERLMTTRELAERLNVPEPTIYGWRYKGEGPPVVRVGGRLRYRWSDVDAWLRDQTDAYEAAEAARRSA